jgi:hypothetical protein
MTPQWFTLWFKDFVASNPEMNGLKLLPNMIRPSVLLRAALENDGRVQVGIAIGQHSIGNTQGYQNKWPTRLIYDQHIRRFLNAYETLVIRNIEDAAEKFGIPKHEFEDRLRNLEATGLGTFCADSRGRNAASSSSCTTLDCWDDCPHMLIVAQVEAIASLQIWQASLRQSQPEWERDQPDRWDKVWLPWLCLTDVVEEKMVRGPHIKTWNAATKLRSELERQPGFIPPRPW